ncbi:MFS transporter [Magnaporthiopsis poae ATCC 64411]|uniref:MFS transporter n=1 Tax=Magnaporthiopsis poae (strain ATCC 64411 / 73-15) TaxID=644358 RepID=A0A0C4DQF1_MAGP6|nr:MFS transporter [Magnaporthiopsis poae ATCC 64411]
MAARDATKPSFTSRLPFFGGRKAGASSGDSEDAESDQPASNAPPKWSFGVLNDKKTIEVPGSVLLLADHKNEPLGLRNAPARTSHSSFPTGNYPEALPAADFKKKTADGKIILEPQPEDAPNDPLNWPKWRRDAALLSIGLYCMVGGGQTSVMAAGFTDIARDYRVPVHQVSLTVGLYMMGMGLGSVFASPTAILYGKRPVYLASAILFVVTSVWCALSPSFPSLVAARIFQGVAVSPVECLPSATVAEIFFLHERAYRLGIYTLLLLGGKNLIPLVSAAIIQSLSWRWVFWIVSFVVAFCGVLLFLFVPETFWERVPHAKPKTPSRPGLFKRVSSRYIHHHRPEPVTPATTHAAPTTPAFESMTPDRRQDQHVMFAQSAETGSDDGDNNNKNGTESSPEAKADDQPLEDTNKPPPSESASSVDEKQQKPPAVPPIDTINLERGEIHPTSAPVSANPMRERDSRTASPMPGRALFSAADPEKRQRDKATANVYSSHWREREAKSFVQQLRPWHGRLNNDRWLKVAFRPFVLFSYPAVLWSSAMYACSVGWLIVVSEAVAVIYREKYYDFDALGVGLVYLSPFIGGVLGTAVAGKVSDMFVKAMARRNGGLYEPEFRLIMALPIGVTTVMGLMGFGWSAEERNNWIVPTVFFGLISFGCCLGSTTSITFCVDSYRQYAGEALVTLNFAKNILHGLVFSLFVTEWLQHDGAKSVFIWLGVIQLFVVAFALPLFIYGKRCRMWTVRNNFMEKF